MAKIIRTGSILVHSSAKRKQGRVRLTVKEIKPQNTQTPFSSPRKQDRSPQKSPVKGQDWQQPLDDIPSAPTLEDHVEGWADEVDDSTDINHKSQHDFVREWIPRIGSHLKAIVARKNLSNRGLCYRCSSSEGWWKCLDCMTGGALCRGCCREEHLRAPFHRIVYWTGEYYKQDWLYNLGLSISLGHEGHRCPLAINGFDTQTVTRSKSHPRKVDIYYAPSGVRNQPLGAELFTIGHINGIHKMWIQYCHCHNKADLDIQLLAAGLFPLSFQNCRSAFTLRMLDDFRKTNLICKVSSYLYYKKLRRLTHPWFFDAVPDRYKELRRTHKQSRYLKLLEYNGYHHVMDSDTDAQSFSPGSLGLFCAACPQEGINIPGNWREDPEQLPYTRSFVMDGNFSASHLRQREVSAEPWLSDGAMFLVRRRDFDEYIEVATEEKETPTCNKYHAVNDRLIKHKGRDITGIGSTACARHGAFSPGGTVNFQKGERQVNMDYSICSAIANTHVGNIPNLILLYDINCQYNVNFRRRVECNPGIAFPDGKKIYWGIGEFHVTAHVPHCFPRHSPQFIPGAGCVDGEVLETLWSLLKDIFPSTQTSTLASRAEMLDSHIQESNWKKMVGIANALSTRYKKAEKGTKESKKYFDKLSKNLAKNAPHMLQEWENAATVADLERIANPAAMDVYDTTYEAKVSRAQRQNEELQDEISTGQFSGATAWLVEGMKLQELHIRVLTKRAHPTDAEKKEILRKREQLQNRLGKFHDLADGFIPSGGSNTELQLSGSRNDWLEDDFGDEIEDEEPVVILDQKTKKTRKAPILDSPHKKRRPNPSTDPTLPENVDIVLPSTLGFGICDTPALLLLVAKELNLREGQAADALAAIRLDIGEKSFLLRKKIRPVVSKKQKGKSWQSIHKATRRIRMNQWIYTKARDAMMALGAPQETLAEYRVMKDEDLKTITSVVVLNAPSQKGVKLSWIWYSGMPDEVDEAGEVTKTSVITELTRVNWLRARANNKRHQEEVNLSRREMVWSVRYFLYRSDSWKALAGGSNPELRPHAVSQAEMWKELASHAYAVYLKTCKPFTDTFGYKKA